MQKMTKEGGTGKLKISSLSRLGLPRIRIEVYPNDQVYQKVYEDKTERVCNTDYERKCETKVGLNKVEWSNSTTILSFVIFDKVKENCYIVPDQK